MKKKMISIVTPCFNEEENVFNHFSRVKLAIAKFEGKYIFEHIYTDNVSTDKTFALLQQLCESNPSVRAIRFSRNIGPEKAIFMGLQHALGDAVIVIQADLQDPPELIPDFIAGWEDGNDVVFGKISRRTESYLLQNLRKLYYRIVAHFSEVPIPTDAGEFRLMSRRALDSLLQFSEDDLYIRGAVAQVGFNQKPISYNRAARAGGESKIGFLGLISYAINGLLSTTEVPLRLVTILGFSVSMLGFFLVIFFIISKILAPDVAPRGFTFLSIIITLFFGIQILCLGIIGEYIRKIYHQSLGRPRGFIKDKVNFDE